MQKKQILYSQLSIIIDNIIIVKLLLYWLHGTRQMTYRRHEWSSAVVLRCRQSADSSRCVG